MTDEIVVDVDGPVTISPHGPDVLPALGGLELTSGVIGDILGVRLAVFR